jgi:hypothetical protein
LSAEARRLLGPVVLGLGLAGAALGIAAGFVQLFAGRVIPEWTGNKADTVGLGLATIALTIVAAVCLWQIQRSPGRWSRWVPAVAGIAAVAVCFTTVGRLWYLPGPLLIAALVLALFAEPTAPRGAG